MPLVVDLKAGIFKFNILNQKYNSKRYTMKTILSYSFIALSILFIIWGIKKMNEAKKSGQI